MRCFKKSYEVAPTYQTATQLADEYEYLEDFGAAQEILEDVQSLPSFGLESANAHSQLAYLLMYQGKWDEALPHAETAAESYSGQGLNCMARCAEGLKDWDTAEKYYRACSERYESYSGDSWYLFCIRRGRGDIESAKQVADRFLKSITVPNGVNQLWAVAIRAILDDQKQKAIDTLTQPKDGDVAHFLLAAVLADQMGDMAQRDRLFSEIETRFPSDALMVQLVNLMRRSVANPGQAKWNHPAFLEIADNLYADFVTIVHFTVGEFLANHGLDEQSKDYLIVAATSYDVVKRSCVLASRHLRSQGIEIPESRLNRQPDDRIPFLKPMWRAQRLWREKKYAEARAALDEAVALRPDCTRALLWRVRLNEFEHRIPDAIADLKAVLQHNPESVVAWQGLARWYSCSPDDSLRNGPKSVEYAQKAFDLRVTKRGIDYWCLAIAHAENGNFAKAVEHQEQAIKLEPKRSAWADQLTLFKSRKPFRLAIPDTPNDGVETTGDTF